jgi:hypothetical protein
MWRVALGGKRLCSSRVTSASAWRCACPFEVRHGFERMRLRGLSGARDEFHLAAIVQNLKTLALRALATPPNQPRAELA